MSRLNAHWQKPPTPSSQQFSLVFDDILGYTFVPDAREGTSLNGRGTDQDSETHLDTRIRGSSISLSQPFHAFQQFSTLVSSPSDLSEGERNAANEHNNTANPWSVALVSDNAWGTPEHSRLSHSHLRSSPQSDAQIRYMQAVKSLESAGLADRSSFIRNPTADGAGALVSNTSWATLDSYSTAPVEGMSQNMSWAMSRDSLQDTTVLPASFKVTCVCSMLHRPN